MHPRLAPLGILTRMRLADRSVLWSAWPSRGRSLFVTLQCGQDQAHVLAAGLDPISATTLLRALWLAGYSLTLCQDAGLAPELLQASLQAPASRERYELLVYDAEACPSHRGKGESFRSLPVPSLRIGQSTNQSKAPPSQNHELFLARGFSAQVALAAVRSALDQDPKALPIYFEHDDGYFEVEAANRPESLDRFLSYCERLVGERLDERGRSELVIAIKELGQNAIEWGNNFDSTRRLRLAFRLSDESIAIRISDEGRGFDPRSLPAPDDPLALQASRARLGKRPGGFGVFLARQVLDEMEYNESGNVVSLVKRFQRAGP